jgi:hypothetical protein
MKSCNYKLFYLFAYCKVFKEQGTQSSVGETVAIRIVLPHPMKQSLKTLVNLLCLKGA